MACSGAVLEAMTLVFGLRLRGSARGATADAAHVAPSALCRLVTVRGDALARAARPSAVRAWNLQLRASSFELRASDLQGCKLRTQRSEEQTSGTDNGDRHRNRPRGQSIEQPFGPETRTQREPSIPKTLREREPEHPWDHTQSTRHKDYYKPYSKLQTRLHLGPVGGLFIT